MTAQIGERLLYEGREVTMCTEPLNEFFALGGPRPRLAFNCTALSRGYFGTWEIRDGRLYLIELAATLSDGSEATLTTVFPGFPDRVFAHWYSGTLRVPQGKQLKYVQLGYRSQFERDLLIEIDKGIVRGTHTRHNGKSDDQAGPEGYAVGGFVAFPIDVAKGPEQ